MTIAQHELKKGALVDLLPYDQVFDHYGIQRSDWDEARDRNPHEIEDVWYDFDFGNDSNYLDAIELVNDKWALTWPPKAFVLYKEPTIVEVGDLL